MKEERVSLTQLLNAREERSKRQQQIVRKYSLPLICFTMNIAGNIKTSPLIKLAFDAGLDKLEKNFNEIVHSEKYYYATGPEAYYVLDLSATRIKDRCCEIENNTPIGRLYDLDVLDVTGKKLSRDKARECIVCDGPVAVCARSRAHGLETICEKMKAILMAFAAGYLADTAVHALTLEARLTPKPGLVDMNNSGSHSDMDLELFYRSAKSLRTYFETAVKLGIKSENCMEELQSAGLQAENLMFAITSGVNTHKGAIYGMGLLLAALGSCLSRQDNLFLRASLLAKSGIPAKNTNGAAVVARYGARGARQEAESGFPSVKKALNTLNEKDGDALSTLMEIILECDDTNLLHRGGDEGLVFARRWAKKVLHAAPESRHELLLRMDAEFIKRNLSPGGSADILAQALFLKSVEKIFRF